MGHLRVLGRELDQVAVNLLPHRARMLHCGLGSAQNLPLSLSVAFQYNNLPATTSYGIRRRERLHGSLGL